MSSPKDIRAGGAYVEIFTENSRLARGLKQAQAMIAGWGAGLRSIGAKFTAPLALAGVTGIAGLVALGSQLGEFGGQVEDMATRTGLSTEAVTELSHAAEMSGTDIGTLEGGLVRMQRVLAEARSGNKAAIAQLTELGISLEQIEDAPDAQLEMFADRIAAIRDPAARTAAVLSIFGKSGQKLLPLLIDGAEGIRDLRREAIALGRSMSREDVAAANELGDTIDKLKGALKSASFSVAATFAPALIAAFDWLAKVAGGAARWVRDNRTLVLSVLAVAAASAGLGAVLMGLGIGLQVLAFAIGGLVTLWTGLGAAIAFVSNPVGLVIAGLALLTTWFLTSTNTGQQALATLGTAWMTLRGEATSAWSAIVAAIAAGDLQAAFDVGMAYLRLNWIRLNGWMAGVWRSSAALLLETWQMTVAGASLLFVEGMAGVETTWVRLTASLNETWDSFVSTMRMGWFVITESVRQALALVLQLLNPMEDVTERLQALTTAAGQQEMLAPAFGRMAEMQRERQRNQAAIAGTARAQESDIAMRRRDQGLAILEGFRRPPATGIDTSAEEQALAEAQKKFAEAVDRAGSATSRSPESPVLAGSASFQPGAQQAQKVADAADIRTSEGLKQILTAFQGGNAASQTASNTAKTNGLLAETNDMLEEQGETLGQIWRDLGSAGISLQEAGT